MHNAERFAHRSFSDAGYSAYKNDRVNSLCRVPFSEDPIDGQLQNIAFKAFTLRPDLAVLFLGSYFLKTQTRYG